MGRGSRNFWLKRLKGRLSADPAASQPEVSNLPSSLEPGRGLSQEEDPDQLSAKNSSIAGIYRRSPTCPDTTAGYRRLQPRSPRGLCSWPSGRWQCFTSSFPEKPDNLRGTSSQPMGLNPCPHPGEHPARRPGRRGRGTRLGGGRAERKFADSAGESRLT